MFPERFALEMVRKVKTRRAEKERETVEVGKIGKRKRKYKRIDQETST